MVVPTPTKKKGGKKVKQVKKTKMKLRARVTPVKEDDGQVSETSLEKAVFDSETIMRGYRDDDVLRLKE